MQVPNATATRSHRLGVPLVVDVEPASFHDLYMNRRPSRGQRRTQLGNSYLSSCGYLGIYGGPTLGLAVFSGKLLAGLFIESILKCLELFLFQDDTPPSSIKETATISHRLG